MKIAIIDRGELAVIAENVARENQLRVEFVACASVLEVLGENAPTDLAGVMVDLQAAGPLLPDLLRLSEKNADRLPVWVVGEQGPSGENAARAILGRAHVRWTKTAVTTEQIHHWLNIAVEVQELRRFRHEHETAAAALREGRMQLFHGFVEQYKPVEGPLCGPPLPTNVEEIQALKDARAQFERSHIRAAVREWGSLKDASTALGISYTSLWRRMR